jgi:hypothetical protein
MPACVNRPIARTNRLLRLPLLRLPLLNRLLRLPLLNRLLRLPLLNPQPRPLT